jgi:hypothetical protein
MINDIEPFVDVERAAQFLSVKPRFLLARARSGEIPAHPLGPGPRKVWRFRLSELSRAFNTSIEHNLSRQPSTAKRS